MSLIQDHFNKAYLGVIAQGKPSLNSTDRYCVYRAPDGSKCAFGHLLKSKDYCKSMDYAGGQSASTAIDTYNLKGFDDNLDFYDSLQQCHDNAADDHDFVASFKNRMAVLAKDYGLTVPVI